MSETRRDGIGFFGLLAVLFIGLKLTGFITWSWWWVLGPLWLPFAVLLAFCVAAGAVLLVTFVVLKVIE